MITSRIRAWRTDPENPLNPEIQIERYTIYLKGTIKPGWQVVPINPRVHVLYYEIEESVGKPELAEGFEKTMRDEAAELKKTKRKR